MRYNEFLLSGREREQSETARRRNESGLAEYIRQELGNDISLIRVETLAAGRHRSARLPNRVARWLMMTIRPHRRESIPSGRVCAAAAVCLANHGEEGR